MKRLCILLILPLSIYGGYLLMHSMTPNTHVANTTSSRISMESSNTITTDPSAIENKKTIEISGSIPYFSQDDLIRKSDIIVAGTVSSIDPSRKGLFAKSLEILTTDIHVKIKKIFKGTPYNDNEVVVQIQKGENEHLKIASDGYPDFEKNEKVLLFLSVPEKELYGDGEFYILTGMIQGKYISTQPNNETVEFESYSNVVEKDKTFNTASLAEKLSPLL